MRRPTVTKRARARAAPSHDLGALIVLLRLKRDIKRVAITLVEENQGADPKSKGKTPAMAPPYSERPAKPPAYPLVDPQRHSAIKRVATGLRDKFVAPPGYRPTEDVLAKETYDHLGWARMTPRRRQMYEL